MKRLFSLAAFLFILLHFQAVAGSSLPVTRSIGAPVGFAAACAKYKWLCGRMAAQQLNDQAGTALLQKVNRAVNGRIIPGEDRPSSRNKDVWSLPVAGRGDCEDYALQKMKDLIEAGFPSNRLALSVVIGPHDQNHVVLIARTDGGDYVLDNLTSAVRLWRTTGYTFLATQDFQSRTGWRVTLAGPRAGEFS
ncbi:transglutaminase-like cysteine peptidase [Rhizobium leguminosarum]|uniref:transglutaminase-like cysteine peptidase n=1 Tax=Rhizobium leguminosarum TaxID=384 RepID=UPI001C921B15|nr:transglutaminase-like cysteine peptidase [Rhizobium leguminosarum]MBY2925947.1 transglutaminase-like cysteine peptidase [Rhizobium leguminosarum]MBY2987956.1 transglutaminase-like cysteine peptidase [Rhizobium leguminosarum]MBY3020912.1 transglutaminase-like cysteine peptidase [Rhizobium leguminosarum]